MWWGNSFVSRGCWEDLVIKMNVEFGWLEGRLLHLQAVLGSSLLLSIWLSMRWRPSSWSCPGHGDQASLGAGAAVKGGSRSQAESAVLAVCPDQSVCSDEEVINQNCLLCSGWGLEMRMFPPRSLVSTLQETWFGFFSKIQLAIFKNSVQAQQFLKYTKIHLFFDPDIQAVEKRIR